MNNTPQSKDLAIILTHNHSVSGISITYDKHKQTLWISGWYENTHSIQGTLLPLEGFVQQLQLPLTSILMGKQKGANNERRVSDTNSRCKHKGHKSKASGTVL